MASLNSDGSGSGVPALGPFCYLFHAQQTKGTAAPPLNSNGRQFTLGHDSPELVLRVRMPEH